MKKKTRLSISISNELFDFLDKNTMNKSKYVEYILMLYYNDLGIDIKDLKK